MSDFEEIKSIIIEYYEQKKFYNKIDKNALQNSSFINDLYYSNEMKDFLNFLTSTERTMYFEFLSDVIFDNIEKAKCELEGKNRKKLSSPSPPPTPPPATTTEGSNIQQNVDMIFSGLSELDFIEHVVHSTPLTDMTEKQQQLSPVMRNIQRTLQTVPEGSPIDEFQRICAIPQNTASATESISLQQLRQQQQQQQQELSDDRLAIMPPSMTSQPVQTHSTPIHPDDGEISEMPQYDEPDIPNLNDEILREFEDLVENTRNQHNKTSSELEEVKKKKNIKTKTEEYIRYRLYIIHEELEEVVDFSAYHYFPRFEYDDVGDIRSLINPNLLPNYDELQLIRSAEANRQDNINHDEISTPQNSILPQNPPDSLGTQVNENQNNLEFDPQLQQQSSVIPIAISPPSLGHQSKSLESNILSKQKKALQAIENVAVDQSQLHQQLPQQPQQQQQSLQVATSQLPAATIEEVLNEISDPNQNETVLNRNQEHVEVRRNSLQQQMTTEFVPNQEIPVVPANNEPRLVIPEELVADGIQPADRDWYNVMQSNAEIFFPEAVRTRRRRRRRRRRILTENDDPEVIPRRRSRRARQEEIPEEQVEIDNRQNRQLNETEIEALRQQEDIPMETPVVRRSPSLPLPPSSTQGLLSSPPGPTSFEVQYKKWEKLTFEEASNADVIRALNSTKYDIRALNDMDLCEEILEISKLLINDNNLSSDKIFPANINRTKALKRIQIILDMNTQKYVSINATNGNITSLRLDKDNIGAK